MKVKTILRTYEIPEATGSDYPNSASHDPEQFRKDMVRIAGKAAGICYMPDDYLSNGIATVINFYNPELIVMGGGLIDAVDEFYYRTINKAKTKALPIPASKVEFKKAQLGDFSGVIGACFLEDLQKLNKVKQTV